MSYKETYIGLKNIYLCFYIMYFVYSTKDLQKNNILFLYKIYKQKNKILSTTKKDLKLKIDLIYITFCQCVSL